MTCTYLLEVTKDYVPAKRKPGCRNKNPQVVVLGCEIYGRVTPRPAKDPSIRCCKDCKHYPTSP